MISIVRTHAVARVSAAVGVAIATYSGLTAFFPTVPAREAVLVGWNGGGVVLLLIAWSAIVRADAPVTRQRAGADDPGGTFVYAIVVLTSAASLLAATVLARTAHTLTAEGERILMGLCLATVSLSWTITHTAFTLRYAHLYYREDSEGTGGLVVPGSDQPTYFDFAYFAFTIGMCFQVSDIAVTSRQIRQTVLLHALISFGYNSVILAFVLNLVFSLAA
ncbi:MAG: DUF1345 domain-containing protein [Polyangiaceae bacterium]|nr:DUF1345 domain-containing protein [Polyangiaceae bacterium]